MYYRLGWAGACANPKGFISLSSLGHFTHSADCYEGLHLNKACLIPLPNVTSREPDRSTSNNDADDHNDGVSDVRVHPQPAHLFLKSNLPEAADIIVNRFQFCQIHSTGREDQKRSTASLNTNEIQFSQLSPMRCQ